MPRPILIAGPTAAGKTALALGLARALGGLVINADALQMYRGWRILTARPSPEEEALAPHRLFGTVGMTEPWSAGHWLRAVTRLLAEPHGLRPIFVGGTGLYFLALTEGLADIPPTPPDLRARADALRRAHGRDWFAEELARRDPATLASGIDRTNPMRLQRAWEVLENTGRGLAAWHAETPPPLVTEATRLHLAAEPAWLNHRIARRFSAMLAAGAPEEVAANAHLDPAIPSMQALGAAPLAAHLRGELTLEAATDAAITATRQYAKRQRTWFRARMADWIHLDPADPGQALAQALAASG
ncbi:MAG TPA: tRNA (adenosine(37)-N6)-dimethylallyltransferase MiaA [Paracoccaceae bacterium]|nr:tRNA (adenosine(37)-N6)-dimethylallyltransferase MiaA [Paracoccaceae bacterium]